MNTPQVSTKNIMFVCGTLREYRVTRWIYLVVIETFSIKAQITCLEACRDSGGVLIKRMFLTSQY